MDYGGVSCQRMGGPGERAGDTPVSKTHIAGSTKYWPKALPRRGFLTFSSSFSSALTTLTRIPVSRDYSLVIADIFCLS